jgi:hypothetical protein
MNTKSIVAGLLSFVTLTTLVASADSLEEQKARKKQQAEVDDMMKSMNKSCDAKITMTVEWDSWNGKIDAGAPKKTSTICYKPIWVIEQLCSDKDAKPAVQKDITSIVCRGGGGDQATVKLDGKTLVYTGSIDQKKAADVKEYLMKNLK